MSYIRYMLIMLMLLVAGGLSLVEDAVAHKTVSNTDCGPKGKGGVYHTNVCGHRIASNTLVIRPHRHELRDDGTIANKPGDTATVLEVFFEDTTCVAHNFAVVSTVVDCFRSVFMDIGQTAIEFMVNEFGYFVRLIVILVILFFGIKVVFGGTQIKSEFFTMLIKLGVVFYFASSSAVIVQWWGWAVDAPVELGSLITEALFDPVTGAFHTTGRLNLDIANLQELITEAVNNDDMTRAVELQKQLDGLEAQLAAIENQSNLAISCPYINVSMANPLAIFARFDCMINHTLGIHGDLGDFVGLGAVVMGTLFVGGIGGVIAFVIFAAFFLMFAAFFQATVVYLTAIIAMTIMAALLPLILPMWLFGDRKLQGMAGQFGSFILAYIIQPFIMFVFVSIMLIGVSFVASEMENLYRDAYKTAIRGGGNTKATLLSTGTTKSGEEQTPTFLENLIEQRGLQVDQAITGSTGYYEYRSIDGGAGARAVYRDGQVASTELEMKVEVPILDWNKEQRRKYLTISIAYLIFMWIMYSFLRRIPDLSGQLVGRIHPPEITSSLSHLPDKAYEAVRSRAGKVAEKKKQGK